MAKYKHGFQTIGIATHALLSLKKIFHTQKKSARVHTMLPRLKKNPTFQRKAGLLYGMGDAYLFT